MSIIPPPGMALPISVMFPNYIPQFINQQNINDQAEIERYKNYILEMEKIINTLSTMNIFMAKSNSEISKTNLEFYQTIDTLKKENDFLKLKNVQLFVEKESNDTSLEKKLEEKISCKYHTQFHLMIEKLNTENEILKTEILYLKTRIEQLIIENESNKIFTSSLPSDTELRKIWLTHNSY